MATSTSTSSLTSSLPTSIPGLRAFADDGERFNDVFINAFLPNTDGVTKLERWLDQEFESEVVQGMEKSMSGRKLRMLGVGSGDGQLDFVMIERFLRQFRDIHYVVVEPDVAALEEFKKEVVARELDKRVEFEWHATSIEQYTTNAKVPSSYDFISVIHTAYYLEDFRKSMDHLLDWLSDGGLVLLAHKSETNKTAEFVRSLPWYTNTSHISPGTIIREAVQRRDQRRIRVFPFPATIDITSVFEDGSVNGPKLLDFLTQGAHFCRVAPANVVESTIQLLRSMTSKEDLDDDDDRVLIRNDFEIILIS